MKVTTICLVGDLFKGKSPLLMLRHRKTGLLEFPGGKVDDGETVADAVKREVEEECGVYLVDDPYFLGVYTHNICRENKPCHHACFVFSGWTTVPEDAAVMENGKFSEIKWIDPKNPPEDLYEPAYLLLEKYNSNRSGFLLENHNFWKEPC